MSEETIKCPKCGAENENDNIYCKECGKDLTKKKTVRKPSSTLETISYVISFSVFAFVLGFLAFLKFSDSLGTYNGDSENVFQQIYNAIQVVGCAVSICIGIVISFAIILFARVNKKLNDIYVLLNKSNKE